MAGAAAVVTEAGGPGEDIGRVAALAAWWTSRGLYELDVPVQLRAVGEWRARHELDRDRLTRGLPDWCCYVAAPPRPTDLDPAAWWSYGVYVHAEHDTNTGRPELRVLLDTAQSDDPARLWSARGPGEFAYSTVVGSARSPA